MRSIAKQLLWCCVLVAGAMSKVQVSPTIHSVLTGRIRPD